MARPAIATCEVEEMLYVILRSTPKGDLFLSNSDGWTPHLFNARRFSPIAAVNALRVLDDCAALNVEVFLSVRRRRQAGFAMLLETLVVFAILTIFASIAVPNFLRIHFSIQELNAISQVSQVARAEAAIAICQTTPNCMPTERTVALVPTTGSTVLTEGYSFHMAADGTTYTATPQNAQANQKVVSVGPDGIILCGSSPCK